MPTALSEEGDKRRDLLSSSMISEISPGMQETTLRKKKRDGNVAAKEEKKKRRKKKEKEEKERREKKKDEKEEENSHTSEGTIRKLSLDLETRQWVPPGESKLHMLQPHSDSPVLLNRQSSLPASDMNRRPSGRADEQYRSDLSAMSEFHNATVANAMGACVQRLQDLKQEQEAKIRQCAQDHTTAVENARRSFEQTVQRVQQEFEAKMSKDVQECKGHFGQLVSIFHENLGTLAEKYKTTTQDDAGAHTEQSSTTTGMFYL